MKVDFKNYLPNHDSSLLSSSKNFTAFPSSSSSLTSFMKFFTNLDRSLPSFLQWVCGSLLAVLHCCTGLNY